MGSVLRKKFKNSFTQVPNCIINDKRVTLKAKGLYLYMISKPDDWEFSFRGMVSQMKEGEAAIRAAIEELCKYGYLSKYSVRNNKGIFETTEYEIFDNPLFSVHTGLSSLDYSARVIQPGKSGTSNTIKSNTIKSNTKKEEEEELSISVIKFVEDIRSKYIGIPFIVDDVEYFIADDGFIKVSTSFKSVAPGRALSIYKRMYASATEMYDYFEDRKKAQGSQPRTDITVFDVIEQMGDKDDN